MDQPSPLPLEQRPPGPQHNTASAIAAELASPAFPRGDLASLRRMNPDVPGRAPALLKLLARHYPNALAGPPESLRRWSLVLHGMALMAPDCHRSPRPVGEALFAANYAESRLARLLSARGDQFRALVPRLCRHLKAKDQRLNWQELAMLVMAEGRDESRAEECRLRIASAYYRQEATARKAGGEGEDDAE